MGMFDSVYFVDKKTKLPKEFESLRAKEWQTKDLYNALYRLEIRNNQVHYVDLNKNLHLLPMTTTFSMHSFDDTNGSFSSLTLTVVNGKIKTVKKTEEPTSLPNVPAMEEDAKIYNEKMTENIENFNNIFNDVPFHVKVNRNFRRFLMSMKEALSLFVISWRKLFLGR